MMADERFYVAASFFMGVFGYVVSKHLDRVLARMRGKDVQAFDAWAAELERHAFDLCRAHLDAATLQAGLAGLLAKMPTEFQPATFKALALGEALERAVLAEAERRGLVPASGEVAPETGDSAPGGAVLPFPGPGPTLVWRGGQLEPARRQGS